MDKTRFFEELTALLIQENDTHELIIENAKAINSAIKADDPTTLQTLTARYDEQICHLEKVEERRLEICNAFWKTEGSGESVRLASLLEHSSPAQRNELEKLQASLKSKITDLSRINTSNRILLEETLGVIEQTFGMINQATQKLTGYRHKGNRSTTSLNPIFNHVV